MHLHVMTLTNPLATVILIHKSGFCMNEIPLAKLMHMVVNFTVTIFHTNFYI